MKTITVDVTNFGLALDFLMEDTKLDINELSYRLALKRERPISGIYHKLSSWLKGRNSPTLSGLADILEICDYDLVLVPKEK